MAGGSVAVPGRLARGAPHNRRCGSAAGCAMLSAYPAEPPWHRRPLRGGACRARARQSRRATCCEPPLTVGVFCSRCCWSVAPASRRRRLPSTDRVIPRRPRPALRRASPRPRPPTRSPPKSSTRRPVHNKDARPTARCRPARKSTSFVAPAATRWSNRPTVSKATCRAMPFGTRPSRARCHSGPTAARGQASCNSNRHPRRLRSPRCTARIATRLTHRAVRGAHTAFSAINHSTTITSRHAPWN